MLQLKQRSFEINDKVKSLFTHLVLDTTRIDYGFIFDRVFLREEIRIVKQPWAGKVNSNEKQFKIIRSKPDFLKTDFSSVIIKGQEKEAGNRRQIEVSFGISWKQSIVFIVSVFSLAFIVSAYFSEKIMLMTLLCTLMLHALLIAIELRKTTRHFDQYLTYLNKNPSR